jgi:hypothetical protein
MIENSLGRLQQKQERAAPSLETPKSVVHSRVGDFMTNCQYSGRLAFASNALGYASIALLFLLLLDFSSDGASAQRWYRDPPYSLYSMSPAPVPAQQVEAPKQTAAPKIDPSTPFVGALASCDKGLQKDVQFSLPGLKGEVKLDRCYRGRKELVCRFDAILAEGKSLTDEFTRIVDQRYPEVTNLEEICKIDFEALVNDSAGSTEFAKRFASARSEYEARTGCANKVKQSIQDVTLPDLVQAPEVIKSLIEAVDREINRVSVVQEQVSGLAAKIDSSYKSIAVLQKIHRAMCLKSKPDAVSSTNPEAEKDRGRTASAM